MFPEKKKAARRRLKTLNDSGLFRSLFDQTGLYYWFN